MSSNFLVTAVAAVSLVAFSASGFTEEAIKGSKSDTSDRMGGGGGRSGGSAPAGAINLNRNGGRDTPSPGTH